MENNEARQACTSEEASLWHSLSSSEVTSVDGLLDTEDDYLTRDRTFTPHETRVPQDVWYKSLVSEFGAAWMNVGDLWRKRSCWSKLYAIISFFCLPFRAFTKAATAHDRVTVPNHTAVGYLFLLLCYTFVINLIELDSSHFLVVHVRYYFFAACIVLAIVGMLYLFWFTKGRVHHDPCHDASLRIFFRGGLYIFGFASMVNGAFLAIDFWRCDDESAEHIYEAIVQAIKALFIVTETLFLGYFHKARLPLDTAFLQVVLAHILGTNLTLWFWTLCREATDYLNPTNCTKTPINWPDHQKYFYPVFIEYLILAITIIYDLWANLTRGKEVPCRNCQDCPMCMNKIRHLLEQVNQTHNNTFRQRYVPRCGLGIMCGSVYLVVFLVVMLVAIDKGVTSKKFKEPYFVASIVMYLSETAACYIVLVALQSPNNPKTTRSVDYDDALLCISLIGILLLEGFHMLSKLYTRDFEWYVYAVDVTGTIQHLTQTVTLMNLRHYRRASSDRNKAWICECVLFLLLTNIAWWLEDSFYLKPSLTRPGENSTLSSLETYGNIVKPMVIFFRFHSSTYFFHAWTIYKV